MDWLTIGVAAAYYFILIRPDAKRRAQERRENAGQNG